MVIGAGDDGLPPAQPPLKNTLTMSCAFILYRTVLTLNILPAQLSGVLFFVSLIKNFYCQMNELEKNLNIKK